MAQQRPPGVVERKVFFHRIWSGRDIRGKPIPVDFRVALAEIQGLVADPEWYLEARGIDDGNFLCLLPDVAINGYLTARFCVVRRAGLPQLEAAGQILDLNLRDDQGLLESSHMVFLPNNVIGVEYNHFGPRVSRLPEYLERKTPDLFPHRIQIAVLVRGDTAAILDELPGIHLLDLVIIPAQVDYVNRLHGGIGAALTANAELVGDPEIVSLYAKPTRNRGQGFLRDIVGAVRAMANDEEFRADAKRLRISGRLPGHRRIEAFDLLKDDITGSAEMIKVNPRGRALDSRHAYAQIVQAYDDLYDEIQASIAVLDGDVDMEF